MTKLTLTLAILLMITLAGCATSQTPRIQLAKPIIETTAHPTDEAGRCLDGKNLGELLRYIYRLEDGY